jgi:hypothetical protein
MVRKTLNDPPFEQYFWKKQKFARASNQVKLVKFSDTHGRAYGLNIMTIWRTLKLVGTYLCVWHVINASFCIPLISLTFLPFYTHKYFPLSLRCGANSINTFFTSLYFLNRKNYSCWLQLSCYS